MNNFKEVILNKICYTDLVYGRINKKLNLTLSNSEIEELILRIITETAPSELLKKVKTFTLQITQKRLD